MTDPTPHSSMAHSRGAHTAHSPAERSPRAIVQLDIPGRDTGALARFYERVFGWRVGPEDAAGARVVDGGGEPLIQLRRQDGAGLGAVASVLVADAAAAAARVVAAGGEVRLGPEETGDGGFYVVSRGPAGVRFGLWQPGLPRAAAFERPSAARVTWLEVPCGDLAAAVAYYAEVMGWSFARVVGVDGAASWEGQGGLGVSLVAGEELPHATPYVGVGDVEAAAERAVACGGRLVVAPVVGATGTFAVFEDPFGNRIGAHEAAS